MMVVENLVINPLALASASGIDGGASGLRHLLRDLTSNPLVLALSAALALRVLGLSLPERFAETLELLARMSAPAALLVRRGHIGDPASRRSVCSRDTGDCGQARAKTDIDLGCLCGRSRRVAPICYGGSYLCRHADDFCLSDPLPVRRHQRDGRLFLAGGDWTLNTDHIGVAYGCCGSVTGSKSKFY